MTKHAITALSALTLAGICFAPINERPPGVEYTPEQSQATVEAQQQYTGVVDEVGFAVEDTTPREMSGQNATDNAAEAMGVVAQSVEEREAGEAIAAAAKVEKSSNAVLSKIWWGLAFLILAVAAVFGLKRYADKHMPEPQVKPSGWD